MMSLGDEPCMGSEYFVSRKVSQAKNNITNASEPVIPGLCRFALHLLPAIDVARTSKEWMPRPERLHGRVEPELSPKFVVDRLAARSGEPP